MKSDIDAMSNELNTKQAQSDTVHLTETGLVTRVDEEYAWVNTQAKLACSSCKVESTCGNSVLEKFLGDKLFVSKIKNELNAKVGDQVVLSIPKSSITKASLIAYWLPLACMILAAMLGNYWSLDEVMVIGLSFSGFAGGLGFIYYYNQKLANTAEFTPKMVSCQKKHYQGSAYESIKIKQLTP